MSKYLVEESQQFLKDIESTVTWIYSINLEQSEVLAERSLERFQKELEHLIDRLRLYPLIGKEDIDIGILKFPIYDGRFSVQWIVLEEKKKVILLALIDLKYPVELREFEFNED